MKRGKLLLLTSMIIVWATAGVYGEQVYIAPILTVDEGGESYGIDERYRDDIYTSIEEQKGALAMTAVKTPAQIKTVRSSYDALKVCKEEKIAYLLYGWIRKSEQTYEGEIRIFDGEGRKNIYTVYEKDGAEDYEAFIQNISRKVVRKLEELFYLPDRDENKTHSRINVQVEAGYWIFINKAWLQYLSGTVSAGGGLEVIPNDGAVLTKKMNLYFSIGCAADYRFGVSGKGAVKSYLHNVNIAGYMNTYLHFRNDHRIYGKMGVVYDFDILSYTDKYADTRVVNSGAVGIVAGLGYKYGISEKVKLVFESDFECIFYKKVMGKYKGTFGVEVEVFKKEYKGR
ncbi:hypothetical protein JO41_07245 [Treponema sp. OMZ 838]|uniref:hypothetical protein n=1 Tax=Treponema sp. OMZ 838 TaxID=1539298 RepID=UPI000530129A|nr:hypothetical protein [Treponema sp. OMZ 838]AIW89611.1 hypothetical protein JO41_07245 [Treponema sp. OMZ 838]